jgi:insulysin
LQIPDASVPLVAKLRLFAHVVNEPAFSRLRTTEQLGYVVMSSAWIHTTAAGILIRVQSEKPTIFVESRIDAFLEDLREALQAIDQNDFEKQRNGLVTKLTQKYVNIDQEYTEFAERINSGTYDFTASACQGISSLRVLILSHLQRPKVPL